MNENSSYKVAGEDVCALATDGTLRIAADEYLSVVYANDKYCDILSEGRKLTDIILAEDIEEVKSALSKSTVGEKITVSFRITDSKNNIKWIGLDGYMSDVQYEGVNIFACKASDITEIKAYQTELEATYNNIPCGIVHFYIDNGFIAIKSNRYYAQMPGNADCSSDSTCELNIHHEDAVIVEQAIISQLEENSSASVDYRAVNDDGMTYWVNMKASKIGVFEGKTLYLAILFDVTQNKNALIELEKERERYSIAMRNSEHIIFEYDNVLNECIFFILDGKTGASSNSSIVAKDMKNIIMSGDVVFREDIPVIMDAWDMRNFSNLHLRLKSREEETWRWFDLHANVIYNSNGKPIKVMGNMQDIDDIKQKELHLEQKAKVDQLSKVYNRETTITEIDSYFNERTNKKPVYFCILDLDNFKKINDTYGHLYADSMITMAAASIRECLGKDSIIGRLGGDEFVMLIKNSSHEDVCRRIDDIVRSIFKLRLDENDTDGISCSIGIVKSDVLDSPTYNSLFDLADKALYMAKKSGKNRFVFYDENDKEMNMLGMMSGVRKKHKGTSAEPEFEHDFMSVAFEILDRSDNLHDATRMLLKHIGVNLRLEKIKIMQVNQMTNEVIIAYAWARDVNEPEKSGKRGFYAPEDITEYINLFNKSTIVRFQPTVIKHFSKKMQDQLNKHNNRVVFYGAVIEDSDEFSMILYQSDDLEREWTTADLNTLQEITKVLSMYINRNRKIEATENRMTELLNFDELTKTFTLKRFREVAQRAIEENETRYMLVYSDFVHFKYINDLYGYAVGDEILCDFADFVRNRSIGKIDTLSRISGDEFISLVPVTDEAEAVEHILKINSEYCNEKNKKYSLANLIIRSGIYFLNSEDNAIISVDRANLARKTLAHLTKCEAAVFDEDMYSQLMFEAEMSRSMRSALENGEFVAFLQPKVDINTSEIVGAEALVRWFKPDGTMIPPFKFIPYFERNGFVTEIDFCIFTQVVKLIAERQAAGKRLVPISVNLSRVNAQEFNLADKIINYLEEYNVSPDNIEFEITETVFGDLDTNFVDNINKLREYGFRIDIDDFGSGYSSLNMLTEMPADIIKLDKSLLTRSIESEKKAEIIKHTINMVSAIDYDVICEGVETKDEVEFLKGIGCHKVQGFYYSRPVTIKDFCDMLEKVKIERD